MCLCHAWPARIRQVFSRREHRAVPANDNKAARAGRSGRIRPNGRESGCSVTGRLGEANQERQGQHRSLFLYVEALSLLLPMLPQGRKHV